MFDVSPWNVWPGHGRNASSSRGEIVRFTLTFARRPGLGGRRRQVGRSVTWTFLRCKTVHRRSVGWPSSPVDMISRYYWPHQAVIFMAMAKSESSSCCCRGQWARCDVPRGMLIYVQFVIRFSVLRSGHISAGYSSRAYICIHSRGANGWMDGLRDEVAQKRFLTKQPQKNWLNLSNILRDGFDKKQTTKSDRSRLRIKEFRFSSSILQLLLRGQKLVNYKHLDIEIDLSLLEMLFGGEMLPILICQGETGDYLETEADSQRAPVQAHKNTSTQAPGAVESFFSGNSVCLFAFDRGGCHWARLKHCDDSIIIIPVVNWFVCTFELQGLGPRKSTKKARERDWCFGHETHETECKQIVFHL